MKSKTVLALATIFLLFASYSIGLVAAPLLIICGYFLGGESGAKEAEVRDYLAGFQEGKADVYAEWQRYIAEKNGRQA